MGVRDRSRGASTPRSTGAPRCALDVTAPSRGAACFAQLVRACTDADASVTREARAMSRTFIIASATDAEAATRAVAFAAVVPDLCVVSPSAAARRAAAVAVGGRWVATVEEELLVEQVPGESGDDVLARLARALREITAYDARSPLIVCDRLDVFGATAFALDENGLFRLADGLERALPVP
jgi:hypothetical protein